MQLGDEETIERRVRVALQNDLLSWDILAMTRQPLIIEKVAPELFKEQNYKTSDGDVKIYPTSYVATYILIQILEEAPQFSPEVRGWAKQLDPRNAWNNRIMFRRWWRDNELLFKERNYAAVRPGYLPPPLPEENEPQPPPAEEPQSPPPPDTPPPPEPAAIPEPAAKPAHTSTFPWVASAALLLLLAIMLFLTKIRTRR